MTTAKQNEGFTKLRYDYYTAGRLAWFSDNMSMGGLLFGYTIELTLKQGMIVCGKIPLNSKIFYSHDIPELFAECTKHSLFSDVQVSADLIQYSSDLLNQRYPSQKMDTYLDALERGHAVAYVLNAFFPYDDFIIQLDESLRNNFSNNDLSIGVMAAHFVNRPQGRIFFHNNVAALKNSEAYKKLLENEYKNSEEGMQKAGLDQQTIAYNLQLHKERLAAWEKAPSGLLNYKNVTTAYNINFEAAKLENYAKNFEYVGRVTFGGTHVKA